MMNHVLAAQYTVKDVMALSDIVANAAWYLDGEVSLANCVAAYQAIGAASLSESLINLASPGVYDGINNSATWDNINGWKRTDGTGYIDTGIKVVDSTWSWIVKISNAIVGSAGFAYVGKSETGKNYAINPREGPTSRAYYNSQFLRPNGAISAGVMCIAGNTAYLNGIQEIGTIPAPWFGGSNRNLWMLALNGLGSEFSPNTIYIQAAAIYNITLLPAQILAISTAMAAL